MPDFVQMALPTGTRMLIPDAKKYKYGRLEVIVSQDQVHGGEIETAEDKRWHISISHPFRYPTWDEMGEVKDEFCPDIFMSIPHPPRKHWLNINPRVMHLWESQDERMHHHMVWEAEMVRGIYGARVSEPSKHDQDK